ncbi:hypothetical protein PAMP_023002 [Pampus punctatissimus]
MEDVHYSVNCCQTCQYPVMPVSHVQVNSDRRLFQDARVVRDSISVNLMKLKGPRR